MSNDDRGVYSPPPDEYDRFDVSEDDDSRRGPLLLAVAIAVIIALAAVVYTAYNQGIRSGGRNEAPLISAPAGPIKSKPENPGGKKQPDTNNAAYDPLDSKSDAKPKPVKVAPPPEQPIERATKPEPAQQKPEPIAQKPATPEPKPEAEPVYKPKPVPKAAGKFAVQIGSFRSEKQASSTWNALRNRLPILLDGVSPDVQRADLGTKGIYFRLRAADFETRADASEFCAALKARAQDCIVVSR